MKHGANLNPLTPSYGNSNERTKMHGDGAVHVTEGNSRVP